MKTLFSLAVCFFTLLQTIHCAEDEKPGGSIQVSLQLDHAEYMHGQPGVEYVMAPTGRLKAILTVRNVSTSDQTLSFSSGQKTDFVIRDAGGKEVKRWSAGMMFTQAFVDLTIAAGKEKEFQVVMDLGEPGKPLPLGKYTAEGILTTRDPITSAQMPFKIVATE